MANKVHNITIEDKLSFLCSLQLIDSELDKIKSLQGNLPLEIDKLKNDLEQINKKKSNIKEEIDFFENQIEDQKKAIEESNKLIKKYNIQKDNVRNDREFGSLEKEIEYQELEITLSKKKSGELNEKKEKHLSLLSEIDILCKEKENQINYKKENLDKIIKENTKKEKMLLEQKEKIVKELLDNKLVEKYQRIRNKVEDGLAVVTVERGASGGSFLLIPAQENLEILKRKEIVTDEYSGRILVDSELMEEVRGKMKI